MSEETPNEGTRSFSVFLAQVDDGEAHAELSRELHALCAALDEECKNTGKAKGKLTLDLAISVEKGGLVTVGYEVRKREPKKSRGGSVFFLTKGRNLTTENPRQQKLPLREAPKPSAEVKEVTAQANVRDV